MEFGVKVSSTKKQVWTQPSIIAWNRECPRSLRLTSEDKDASISSNNLKITPFHANQTKIGFQLATATATAFSASETWISPLFSLGHSLLVSLHAFLHFLFVAHAFPHRRKHP
jgi:hypothetical protein